MLVKNEVHPYYQDTEVVPHSQRLGIAVEAWDPLGGRGHQKELLNDPVLKEIADNHNTSVAQVILRWNLQRGV
ncbi:MAG: aldo/keto reductase, partial [Muribaculaceae bacterium]|nr:aldo/keto reductase [Muribaculaceae bacterium]